MKLLSGLALATTLLVATGSASAQRIAIGYPQPGAQVQAGSQLIVEVDRPVC
jgi:hypothetical protein